jgi:hypothetical protein
MQKAYVADLKLKVNLGELSLDEAKQELANYQKAEQLFNQIPPGLSLDQTKESLDLLKQKQDLTEKIKDKDPSLVKPYKEQIDAIDEKLTNITKNAIQEQTASESVLRNQQPEMGLQEMGEGNIQETPEQGKAEEEVEQTPTALRDVESTAKALEEAGKKKGTIFDVIKQLINKQNGKQEKSNKRTDGSVQKVQSPSKRENGISEIAKPDRIVNSNSTREKWNRDRKDNGAGEVQRSNGKPLIKFLFTGHKTAFDKFDKKYRGTGVSNQGGGVFFSTSPIFAADSAEKSASGGYAFNPQTPTNTPFVSEVEIPNSNMVFAEEAIPSSVAKQIGVINEIDPAKYPTYTSFLYDLQHSYVKDKIDFTDFFEAQNKAAEALHKKGITGHVIDGNEIVIYDEGDVVKKKQTRLYKNDSELISDQYHEAKKLPEDKREDYQNELVAAVESLLSKEQTPTIENPKVTNPLTKAAKTLISNLKNVKIPAVITNNLQKIAKENGIEITDKTTVKDIINALKEKQSQYWKAVDSGISITDAEKINALKSKGSELHSSIINKAQKAIKTLKSVLPNFDIVIHDTEESYNAAVEQVNGEENTKGNFYYIKNNDGSLSGRIDINLNRANNLTVSHEVAHGIMLKVFGENSEIYEKFVDNIRKILNTTTDDYLVDFANKYRGDVKYEEYIVELAAILEQEYLNISPTILQKIAAVINETVSKITFGKITVFEDTKNTKELIDFLNTVSKSIREGGEIGNINNFGATGTINASGSKSQMPTARDVESTAKALEEAGKKKGTIFDVIKQLINKQNGKQEKTNTRTDGVGKTHQTREEFSGNFSGYGDGLSTGNATTTTDNQLQKIKSGEFLLSHGSNTDFEFFDKSKQGEGLGNQGGGHYFYDSPEKAEKISQKVVKEKGGSQHFYQVKIEGDNYLRTTKKPTQEQLNQIGKVNGVDFSKSNFENGTYLYDEVAKSFGDWNENGISDDEIVKRYTESQNKASEHLASKGITGYITEFDNYPNEYHVFDSKNISIKERIKIYNSDAELIADQYHKAKADGSNPELVKAVESLLSKSQMPMSAGNILYADSKILPKPSKKIKNSAVAIKFQESAANFWGGSIVTSETITPEQEKLITENGIQEAIDALEQDEVGNASNWYSTAIQTAIAVAGVIHTELVSKASAMKYEVFAKEKDPEGAARMALRMALAITSQNLNVDANTQYAEEQFDYFKKNGRFDSSKKYGAKAPAISSNLKLANTIIEKMGLNAAEEFISKGFTVATLEVAFKEATGKKVKISGLRNDDVNGAAIFGPKIGQGFLQNLMGKFDPVTIDLWMRRTWGRWTGDVVGDGITENRMAILYTTVMQAIKNKELNIKLPKEFKKHKPVQVKNEKGKLTLTMDDKFSFDRENNMEFVASLNAVADEIRLIVDNHYKNIHYLPMTKDMFVLIILSGVLVALFTGGAGFISHYNNFSVINIPNFFNAGWEFLTFKILVGLFICIPLFNILTGLLKFAFNTQVNYKPIRQVLSWIWLPLFHCLFTLYTPGLKILNLTKQFQLKKLKI